MLNQYPIARYRFGFQVTTPFTSQEYDGSALRGGFGHALRKTACMTRMRDCKQCPLYQTCPYPQIFAPPSDALRHTPPVPYIIEPPPWGKTNYAANSFYEFSLVLIGEYAIAQLPLIAFSWQRAFKKGINHGQAELRSILCENESSAQNLYQENKIQTHSARLTLQPIENTSATLHFRTHLRLQAKGKILRAAEFDSALFLRQLQTRIHSYFPEAIPQPLNATLEAQNFTWREWRRYSNRQKTMMTLGGLIGDITLSQLNSETQRALNLGQWLHVGKETSFGLGRYQLQQ